MRPWFRTAGRIRPPQGRLAGPSVGCWAGRRTAAQPSSRSLSCLTTPCRRRTLGGMPSHDSSHNAPCLHRRHPPPDEQLAAALTLVTEVLGSDLVGAYLHGSSVL